MSRTEIQAQPDLLEVSVSLCEPLSLTQAGGGTVLTVWAPTPTQCLADRHAGSHSLIIQGHLLEVLS